MKRLISTLGIVALGVTASLPARADARVRVDINPFGFLAPPLVYTPYRYYAPPPVVYSGGGRWGDDEWQRNHGNRDWQRNHSDRDWRRNHSDRDWREQHGDYREQHGR